MAVNFEFTGMKQIKSALVASLIKMPYLDKNVMENFRPV